MSVLINASTSSGLIQSADTSGEIELQSNGTTALKVNTNEGIQILNCLGVGNATPSTSGAGITFPATKSPSSDANTLDDYEEGTWTPSLGGNTTYTLQQGTYTKVGRLVTVCWDVQVNVLGTGSVHIFSGMPFTSLTGITNGGSVGFFTGLASNFVSISPRNDGNSSTLVISGLSAAGTAINNNNVFGNGARVSGSMTYFTS
jgi:hypothetical protein